MTAGAARAAYSGRDRRRADSSERQRWPQRIAGFTSAAGSSCRASAGPGRAASYGRPGGNVTGVINLSAQLDGKRLQLLKETVPSISRVAVFWDAAGNGPYAGDTWGRDAQAVGVELQPMELRGPEEF